MTIHLNHATEHLKRQLLTLSALVEESVWLAVQSLAKRDEMMARRVIDEDNQIDLMEVDIEEECLKILALYQPVATDLRFIVTVLKINNDLERVGDLAVNIAERSAFLATVPPVKVNFDFHTMADKTQKMLKKSLDALVRSDSKLAKEVWESDDEVDEMNRRMYNDVKEAVREHPEDIEPLIHMLSVSRHLERIADLATNIAEDVVYMKEGDIIRHRFEEYQA